MKRKSLFFGFLIIALLLDNQYLNAQSLPEPSFTAKDIHSIAGNVLLDGTKLPDVAGFNITGTPLNSNIVSLVGGQLKFASAAGVSDQYITALTEATTPKFQPTGNFTIALKARVVVSSGRGLDMVIRDGKSTSRTIAFHKDKIFLNSHVNPMYSLNAAQDHIYTIVVDKESAGPSKYYFYIDGMYVWGDETASATSSNNIFSFTFGKANANQNLEVYISYLAIDQSGAYKPIVQTTPVNLISYTAQRTAEAIKLSWKTASETNNSHFEIEKSLNGIDFNKIGDIKAKGAGDYFYIDASPLIGDNYYKLMQYDLDGTKKELGIKSVNYVLLSSTNAYPNPARPGDKIYFATNSKKALFKLTDIMGRVFYEGQPQAVGEALSYIDLPSNLSKGLYFLREAGNALTSKIIIN